MTTTFSIPWECPDCGCGEEEGDCYKHYFVFDAVENTSYPYTDSDDNPRDNNYITIAFSAWRTTGPYYRDRSSDRFQCEVSGTTISGWFITFGALRSNTPTIYYQRLDVLPNGSVNGYALVTRTTRCNCPD